MRLTSKGRYAVMAMADLALHGGGERAVPLQDIARRQEISLSYLEQLFARMRRAGLVSGVRGPGGGYRLSRLKQRAATKLQPKAASARADAASRTACGKRWVIVSNSS
jgi:Rrf2 family transcriptional regulator, iron-sulfur cluster assembly transcription factor